MRLGNHSLARLLSATAIAKGYRARDASIANHADRDDRTGASAGGGRSRAIDVGITSAVVNHPVDRLLARRAAAVEADGPSSSAELRSALHDPLERETMAASDANAWA